MPSRHPYFFVSARGRLLSFNLLMVAVTLMVAGVAIFGFRHASQLQEQVQLQTLSDMNGSMNLARDTANVATAAVRLSQVVGALEYKSEAQRLLETQQALKHSLGQLASAPLARQELALVASIIRRSNELQQSVAGMLERGQRRHLQRNELLSALYQNQSYLRHLQDLNDRDGKPAIDPQRLNEMDRLIVAAIHTATPRSIVLQLDDIRRFYRATIAILRWRLSCRISTPNWRGWRRYRRSLKRAIWRSVGICFISKRWLRCLMAILINMLPESLASRRERRKATSSCAPSARLSCWPRCWRWRSPGALAGISIVILASI